MDQKVINTLTALKKRHTMLRPHFSDKAMCAGVDTYLEKALKFNTDLADQLDQAESKRDPKWQKKIVALNGLVERARAGDHDARVELNAIRSTTIDNYVRATSNWSLFFRRVDLADNESPYFTYTYKEEVDVFYIGQDGGRKRFKVSRDMQSVPTPLKVLKTATPEYPTRDIYRGSAGLREAAQAQFDLGFEMKNKVDGELFTLVNASAFASFTTTGNKLSRTFTLNSRVNTSNLPTTNVLTPIPNDNSGTTKFRSACIKAITRYFTSWGGATIDPIDTTGGILIPSSEVADLMDEFAPASAAQNDVGQEVVAMPFQIKWGRLWTLIPDVTLTPGKCYPVPTLPVGEVYYKPSQNRMRTIVTEDQPDMEALESSIVIGSAIPEPWRVRVCRLTYHT